ncbi:MAG TPA: mechanosensitive ion channel domain-containing protein [Opitutus sp.]|nr:mechanosensitive ion channel domain-containing protein [Opitutus sp.]
MNLFRVRPARRGVLVALLFALAGCVGAAGAPDDDRVAGLNEQIRTLEAVVAGTKDASEKARLGEKVQRLQQELKILQERQELEARERALHTAQPRTTLDQLREKLRSVEFVADGAAAQIEKLTAQRRQAAQEREELVARRDSVRAEKNASPDRIVEAEERVATKDEELRAIALERDAWEAETDLAHDGDALREQVKSADTTAGRPTLRAWFESYTRVRAGRNAGGRLGADAAKLAEKLRISQESLDLSRRKLAKFDEELALLEKQTSFFRRDARVERLLAQERNEKDALTARLPFFARQVDAIKRTQRAVADRQELATLKGAFATENYDRLKSAYLHRLLWPAAALLALLVLYLAITLAALPVFLRNEGLFLTRRFARYAVIFLAVVVVAGFLFDDLSMIAATLGIVSAALVISLQDVCTSIAAWFVIMAGGKFGIGDRLEIDGTRGDVLDIQLLRTTLLEINAWLGIDEPTGRVLVLPNNFIFKNKVFNFTHGHPFIWGKIDVTVTFGTPVASALTLFQRVLDEETREQFAQARQAADKMQRRYGIADAVYEPKIYTQIADSGVTLTLFYVAHYREISATRNKINRRLIAEIETHPHIQLAYTTLTVQRTEVPVAAPSAVLGHDVTTPPFARGGNTPPAAVN